MNIHELRREARRREAAARRKIRRNAVEKGVHIEPTQFNPLRDRPAVNTMNSRQLRSYLKRLNKFTSRSTQFEAGVDGAPLPRDMVREYQRLERRRNQQVGKHVATMSDVFIEPQGMTVAQREETILASSMNILRAGGNPQYRPYDYIQRDIEGIPDANALRKLTAQIRRQSSKDFAHAAAAAQRRNHIEFLERHGAKAQAAAVRKLSVRQFDLLQNYTNYANLNQYRYLKPGGDGSDRYDSVAETAEDDITALIDWAGTQERNTPRRRR